MDKPLKIIIAPDKFKGSLTSIEACRAIKKGVHNVDANVHVELFPMADGGDGFASVMKYYTSTNTMDLLSVDAIGREIHSSYEFSPVDDTAIIELASCSGLAMLDHRDRNPMNTSTYGTGLQIRHAIEQGAKKIILGIGGSATNDAGIGILAALGFEFTDGEGNRLQPVGKTLNFINRIIPPAQLPAVNFEIACDVDNPLFGPEGAAMIFSAQKGASPEEMKMLDRGLQHFAGMVEQQTGKDISSFPGAGAAGGIAAGLMAFLPVQIVEGTYLILSASKFENNLKDANLVITGEGKIDLQSGRGKTISAIASLAKKYQIPVFAICGKLELTTSELQNLGISYGVEISDPSISEEDSMTRAYELVSTKAAELYLVFRNLQG